MLIPSSIRIVGKPYVVNRVPPRLDDTNFGHVSHERQVIEIAQGQAHEQERDTLLHEAIHAIDYAVQAGLEERQVHAVAAGLLAVLREHPDFVAWLAE